MDEHSTFLFRVLQRLLDPMIDPALFEQIPFTTYSVELPWRVLPAKAKFRPVETLLTAAFWEACAADPILSLYDPDDLRETLTDASRFRAPYVMISQMLTWKKLLARWDIPRADELFPFFGFAFLLNPSINGQVLLELAEIEYGSADVSTGEQLGIVCHTLFSKNVAGPDLIKTALEISEFSHADFRDYMAGDITQNITRIVQEDMQWDQFGQIEASTVFAVLEHLGWQDKIDGLRSLIASNIEYDRQDQPSIAFNVASKFSSMLTDGITTFSYGEYLEGYASLLLFLRRMYAAMNKVEFPRFAFERVL